MEIKYDFMSKPLDIRRPKGGTIMNNISDEMISEIVKQVVMDNLASPGNVTQVSGASCVKGNVCGEYGVFDSMEDAINAAEVAQQEYLFMSMKDRNSFVETIRQTILEETVLRIISSMSVEETGMGNVGDKIIKNRVAAVKSPGIEDLSTEAISGDNGLTITEYCPFGVLGSITPATNPSETIICNSIGMLAAGNSVVFSPHPKAKKLSAWLVQLLNKELIKVGAPANLITTVRAPSVEKTNEMMQNPKIRMIVTTGGPGIVKLALSSGKKAIGAGAGNPPVVVDETADIAKAAKNIIDGCAFDNNLPCIAEKEVVAVDCIADELIKCMCASRAHLLTEPATIASLWDLTSDGKGGPNKDFVGKDALYIAEKAGINVPKDTKVLILEADKNHPFVRTEMMMPILPIVRANNVDEAISLAKIFEDGNRHTSIMHSKDVEKLSKMGKIMETTIFVKNGPSFAGIGVGGEGSTTFTIAGPTGEGITSARTFCRKRRCVMTDVMHIR